MKGAKLSSSFLLRGSPDESITECSRVPRLKDENVWLWLHGKAIKVHLCLTYQFITVIMESGQGKERNWAFLTALGNRLVRTSPQQEAAAGELKSVFSFQLRNPAKLAECWCLELCAETLFVLLLKFGAVLSIICGFLMAVSCWRRILQCVVILPSFSEDAEAT